MRDVCFAYVEGVPVIKNFNLEVAAGQTIALVGPTGAGKTTIINLLSRFYEIDRGSISIDGVDIRDMRKADLRRALGLVLQDTFLFAGTVLENIRYGRLDATDEECTEAARMAEADHFIRQLPDGYQTATLRAGRQPEPGPAAAAFDIARHTRRPGDPDPRRGHEQRRYPHGAAHPEGAATP